MEAENSVSHIEEFVQKCVECFEKEVEPGTYNMTNPGSVSTRQVTEWMREEGVTDKLFKFFDDEEQFMSKAAKTPRSNCVLDTTKAEKALCIFNLVEAKYHSSKNFIGLLPKDNPL